MLVIITIPAYNEEETLPAVISEIRLIMNATKYKYKIHVQDDGSTDNTVLVAKKLGAVVHSNGRNKGLAITFQEEIKHCLDEKADIIVHTDADGQYPAEYIPKLLEEIEKGADLVIGSRFSGELEDMPLIKRVGNMAFAKVFTQLCKTKITDSTTGFRAFTKELATDIHFSTDFTYTHEQLIRAARLKFRIKEIPIYARKTRESRLMKGPFDYAVKAWINIFRIYRDYNPLAFFGKIGITLLAIGSILSLWVLYIFITEGIVGGIPRVILSAMLILAGIQIILFGLLADMKK
ncbi:glycosyltransferase family 2 protein [Candidatus Woesearchaeota archaeon]|nr:glycosyltransferase family 2 protein [Candidatus Woesearchaeota archaeon]